MSDLMYGGSNIFRENTLYMHLGNTNFNKSNYRTLSINGVSTDNITFYIPSDFMSLISISLIVSSTINTVGPNKNIDLFSSYGLIGENIDINSESDTSTTYTIPTEDTFFELNVGTVFSDLEANHVCGLKITHNSIGGNLHYYAVKLVYLQRIT